jgi:hypothetical protein
MARPGGGEAYPKPTVKHSTAPSLQIEEAARCGNSPLLYRVTDLQIMRAKHVLREIQFHRCSFRSRRLLKAPR